MEKVLVVGANGNTGTRVVRILKNHGQYDPVAMIRNEGQKSKFDEMDVPTKHADLEDNIEGALEDIDLVIFAAGSGSSTGKDKTIEVDQKGAKKLIDEAKRVNLKKFVMLSSMGTDDPSQYPKLEHYLKAKHEADEYLRKSGVNHTIVRPGMLTDDDVSKIKAAEKLNEQGKIPRESVAHVLVSSLDNIKTLNQTVEVLEGDKTVLEALGSLETKR